MALLEGFHSSFPVAFPQATITALHGLSATVGISTPRSSAVHSTEGFSSAAASGRSPAASWNVMCEVFLGVTELQEGSSKSLDFTLKLTLNFTDSNGLQQPPLSVAFV